MKLAFESALKGIRNKEGGPFGATIVCKNKIMAVTHNTVLLDKDPTAHAEINAIRKVAAIKGIDLSDCVIYSTTEPCPMCFSAIHWAKIPKVVYGTKVQDAAKYGFNEMHLSNAQIKLIAHLDIELIGDFMREDGLKLFEEYENLKGQKY